MASSVMCLHKHNFLNFSFLFSVMEHFKQCWWYFSLRVLQNLFVELFGVVASVLGGGSSKITFYISSKVTSLFKFSISSGVSCSNLYSPKTLPISSRFSNYLQKIEENRFIFFFLYMILLNTYASMVTIISFVFSHLFIYLTVYIFYWFSKKAPIWLSLNLLFSSSFIPIFISSSVSHYT